MRLPQIQSQYIALSGGMDLTTPPIVKASSEAIQAINVQPNIGGGFTRIEGYECLDGRVHPSEMRAVHLQADQVVDRLSGKQFILNGATCYVLSAKDNELTVAVQGQLTASKGARFQVDTQTFTLSRSPYVDPELSALDHQALQAKAFAKGCDLVEPVPGQGNLLGVAELGDQLIAMRDQPGQLGVFFTTKQGWQAATTTYVSELNNVSQAERLVENARVSVNGQAVTLLSVILNPEGESATVVTTAALALNAEVKIEQDTVANVKTSAQVRLSQGKRWQFIYHNFYGGVQTQYAYGCNGEEVIELRPNGIIIPIALPATKPQYLSAHNNHLFVAFEGGQFGHSLVGQPRHWSVLLGAEQFGVGDEITALSSAAGGVLLIGCRHKVMALYGTTRDDWLLKTVAKVGIKPHTLQSVFVPVAISDNGIIRVDQTEQFGDFKFSELDASQKLGFQSSHNPIIFASQRAKANQIRFYSETGLHLCIMFYPNGSTASTYFRYPQQITGVWQSPDNTYLAFDDGKVYWQSDKCHSFAGHAIDWHIKLAFNHFGSPTIVKSWHSAELQASASGILPFYYRFDLDYNSDLHATNLDKPLVASGGGGRWNESNWNDFLWSVADYSTPTFLLAGYSRNIAIAFSGVSNFAPQFELSGLIVNYIPRRNFRV